MIVGAGFLGGEGERNCLKGGRGGTEGGPEGGPEGDPGDEGGAPPGAAEGSGVGGHWEAGRLSSSSRCLISGVVGLFRRVVGAMFRRNGLPKAGCEWANGVLVLVCRAGLLHAGGPAGAGGVAGSGILVAMHWISVLASWSWASRVDTRAWCAAAHSSTFP